MRATDIDRTVEYCETGPLAYGVEPSVNNPRRVKFTDLAPGWGWVKKFTVRKTEYGVRPIQDGPAFLANPNRPEFRHVAGYPDRAPSTVKDKPEGFSYSLFTPVKGFYLAQIWNATQQMWEEGLAQPAAIHRTWAEYIQKEQDNRQRAVQRKIDTAPVDFERSMRDALRAAAFAGHDEAFIAAWIKQNWFTAVEHARITRSEVDL